MVYDVRMLSEGRARHVEWAFLPSPTRVALTTTGIISPVAIG